MSQVRSKSLQSIWIKLGEVPELSTAQYLAKEHPQVSALVLSRTPPAYAAASLKMLPTPLRNEIMRRMLGDQGRSRTPHSAAGRRGQGRAALQERQEHRPDDSRAPCRHHQQDGPQADGRDPERSRPAPAEGSRGRARPALHVRRPVAPVDGRARHACSTAFRPTARSPRFPAPSRA